MDRYGPQYDRDPYGERPSRPHDYEEKFRTHDYDESYRTPRAPSAGGPSDLVTHGTPSGYSAYPSYPAPTGTGHAGPSRSPYERYEYEYTPVDPQTSSPQWASSSGRPTSYPPHHYPSSYSAYQYPTPPGPHSAGHTPGAHSEPPWGHWGPPYTSGGLSYPTAPSGPGHSNVPRHPPEPRAPTPPPPASPSQIQRPPPPASAPSPAAEGASPSSAGAFHQGFQPDYDRSRGTRRPDSSEPSSTGGAIAVTGGSVRPPPTEAYLILRPHLVPRGGWESGSEAASQASDSTSGWTFELNVLQHPERGKALGVEHLRRGWPTLTPPLIIQLVVKDKDGEVVPTDNAALARRLVHITMNVELVAPDTGESRSLMRVRPPSPRGNVQPYYPASAPPPYSVQKTLLGSCVRTAQVLHREGRKGLFFIFQDMIVRPEGRYALEGKVLDLAGPPHIGTSIGVTRPLAHCRTNTFDVIVPQEFPGPVPITPLSTEFLRQGERHLGVSAAQLAANAKHKRRPRNEDGESDQEDAGGAE